MPKYFNGKRYYKHLTGVWPEYVPKMKKELLESGYKVRVLSSWKVGRKDIYVRKKED